MADQDAYSDLTLDQASALGAGTPAAAPPVSFFDRVRLGFKRAGAAPDWGWNETRWEENALNEIRDALRKRGALPPQGLPMDPRMGTIGRDVETANLFEALRREREKDPSLLPDYASVVDRSSFEALIRQRRNAELQRIDTEAPEGLGVAGLAGEIGRGLLDPTSYIPVGGGPVGSGIVRRLLTVGAREGAANAGFTAVTEPLVRRDAERLGIERGFGDFAFDTGVSFLGGMVIGGAFEGASIGVEKLRGGKPAVEAAAAPEAAAPPQEASADPLTDKAVAEAFAAAVPPEKRTAAQQAALDAVEREEEVKATSPFVEGPVGDDEHVKWLDLGLQSVTGEAPLVSPAPKPVAREAIAAGTADASATRNPPRATLKAKIHRAEATAADDFNEASGAMGPYQFVERTWVNLFKRRYPNDKRSFEQIAALRRDPALNEVLIDDLINENATALRHAGLPETATNLYLAHFLGHDRAITVLRASGDTPIGRLLPDEYFRDNPWMKRDWSASKLAAWANRKMGGPAEPVAVAAGDAAMPTAPDLADIPDVPEPETGRYDVEAMLGIAGDDRPILKPEMFASAEEHAAAQLRFETARDGVEGFASVRSADELFAPGEYFAAVRAYRGTVTEEAMAEALGIRPDQLRRTVQAMQASDPNSPFIYSQGGKTKKRVVDGKVETFTTEPRLIRRPPKPGQRNTGPESLLEFLASRGGINDVGGDLRSMGAGEWHKGKRFRGRLIREDGEGIDDAFMAAWEAGFFPELGEAASSKPDLQLFRDAIDRELRGKPLYRPESAAEVEAADNAYRWGDERPGEGESVWDRIEDSGVAEDLITRAGERGVNLDDDMLIEAHDRVLDGEDPEQALTDTMLATMYRNLDTASSETGNPDYATDFDGRPWDDEINFAEPGEAFAAGAETGAGGGRSEGVASASEAVRAGPQEPADNPAERRFDDPVAGAAAVAQADSLDHDLRMEAAPKEAVEGEPAPEPDSTTYRLDEDGDESDLASILDEIEQAQKAAAEMRGCMAPPKPKGGGE